MGNRVGRLWQPHVSEAASGDPDQFQKCRNVPIKRRATPATEMTFLVVILRCMMKGLDDCFAGATHHAGLRKIRRYTEDTAGAPLAVGAVANAMHGGIRVDRY